MKTFNSLQNEQKNTAVALGFFDGLHRGHRRVISSAVQSGLTPVCLTFSQSPKSVISGRETPSLMTLDDKLAALDKLGVEHVYLTDFRAVMRLGARDFFERVLVGALKAKALSCGFNYRFGRNAEGDADMLVRLCGEHGVRLTVVPPEKDGGEVVCSTLIKKLVAEGNIRRANSLLCGKFGVREKITHGSRVGRTLGTPTINQPMPEGLIAPKYGVYASSVTLESGQRFCGVTNVGVKPTVGGKIPLWETWMPRYSGGEIYGQTADVRLLDFIRGERKFDSLDALKAEILNNSETAERIYNSMRNS